MDRGIIKYTFGKIFNPSFMKEYTESESILEIFEKEGLSIQQEEDINEDNIKKVDNAIRKHIEPWNKISL